MLMSAKDLGKALNINRNTVASVYKELEKEGFVKIAKGAGTFVLPDRTDPRMKMISRIMDQALDQALKTGTAKNDILDLFMTNLLQKAAEPAHCGRIILIGCNYPILEYLDSQIKLHCQMDSHFMLIQDIEIYPNKFLKRALEYDAVICDFNQIGSLMKAAPDLGVKPVTFLMNTDFSILNEIAILSPQTAIGFCCTSVRSANSFFHPILTSSNSTFNGVVAGLDNRESINLMLTSCDIVFATEYAYEDVVRTAGSLELTIKKVVPQISADHLNYIVSTLKNRMLPYSEIISI